MPYWPSWTTCMLASESIIEQMSSVLPKSRGMPISAVRYRRLKYDLPPALTVRPVPNTGYQMFLFCHSSR